MGKTDPLVFPWYKKHINPVGEIALLGFVNNNHFKGDLYDLSLKNWDINSNWVLSKKYDTIICTRCAYFAKDPNQFIQRCYDSLNDNGRLFVDWGLGDHWRFSKYKIGWIKDGEHENAYFPDNYLWSSVWDDSFLTDLNYLLFQQRVAKFGYDDVKGAIFDEVPNVLSMNDVSNLFDFNFNMITFWEDFPQLYILLSGIKR